MKFLRKRAQLLVVDNIKKCDDEGSVTSTFTADRGAKLDLSSSHSRKSCNVRFDLGSTVEYTTEFISQEEYQERWYIQDEYKQFKNAFINLAKEFQKYDKANPDPESFKVMLGKAFDACCKASDESEKASLLDSHDELVLKKWMDKGSRRGLERVSVPKIFSDKNSRRKKISDAVLDAQYDARNMGSEQRHALLRKTSEQISLPSRLLARILAE